MSDVAKNSQGAPDRIWLQLHGDADPDIEGPGDCQNDEVTWCWEPIFDADVEYVRADLCTKALAKALDKLCREYAMGGRDIDADSLEDFIQGEKT